MDAIQGNDLVSSWVNICLNVVQEHDQTHQNLLSRVWGYFLKYKNFDSERDEKSLMQRWSKIGQATNKFYNYFSQIENRQQSGVKEQDKTLQIKFYFLFDEQKNFI